MRKRSITIVTILVLVLITSTGIVYGKTDGNTNNGTPFEELRAEIDAIRVELYSAVMVGDPVSLLVNDAGYISEESDPLFVASAAYGISNDDLSNWDTAYNWGDHSTMGYLTSETDPSFTTSPAYGVTNDDLSNWNAAYQWGDHSTMGYLITETDPMFTASAVSTIQSADIQNWNTVSWSELTDIPEDFADGVDDTGSGIINSLSTANGDLNAVYVDSDGKVGISTTTPRAGLDIDTYESGLLVSSVHDINWPSGEKLTFNEYYSDGSYAERMRITDVGTVHIYGSKDGHVLYVYNDGAGGNEDGIYIELGDYDPDKNNNYVTFADKDGDTIGRIEGFLADEWDNLDIEDMLAIGMDPLQWAVDRVVRNHGVVYATGNGDYAEYLPKIDPEEEIHPFEIVGVNGGYVSKDTENAQQFMIVSYAPAVVGNTPADEEEYLYEPIAFLGQVLVKATGVVNVGDYILPSGLNDGTGITVSPDEMTVEDYGKVVGVAWSASTDVNTKYVLCVVGLNTNDLVDVLAQQQKQLNEQQQQINELYEILSSLSDIAENTN